MSLIMEENKIVEISDESIQLLQKQIYINDEEAHDLLLKHNSDIVSAILDYNYNIEVKSPQQPQQQEQPVSENPIINNKVNINQCRDIINDKDNIYTTKSGKKINISDCEVFHYIPFTSHSTKFQKLKVNAIRNSFKETIVLEYLNNNLFPYQQTIKNPKLVVKKINNTAKKMYSKWGLINPVVFYYQHQIEGKNDTNSEHINKLGTKFLSKSLSISEEDIFIGPIVIVNNY